LGKPDLLSNPDTTMFDLDQFTADCRAALAAEKSSRHGEFKSHLPKRLSQQYRHLADLDKSANDRIAPEAVARKLMSICVLPYQSAN